MKPLINLIVIAGVLFSFVFFEVLLMKIVDIDARQPVAEINNIFPIIVVSEDKAHLVLGEDLEDFKKNNPNYSFLVPPDKYQSLREQITAKTKARLPKSEIENNSRLPWDAHFTMKPLGSKNQKFIVNATWDDDRENESEYEATEKELFPKYHKFYFGPGQVLLTTPLAILITAIIWGMVPALWRRYKIRGTFK